MQEVGVVVVRQVAVMVQTFQLGVPLVRSLLERWCERINPFVGERNAFNHIREKQLSAKSRWKYLKTKRKKQTWKKQQFDYIKEGSLQQLKLENKYRDLLERTAHLNPETEEKGLTKDQLLEFFKESFGNAQKELFDGVFNLMDTQCDGIC